MYKKTKHGVEIDSQKADSAMKPRFGKRPAPAAVEAAGHEMKMHPPAQLKKTAKKFGKKKARAQKVAIMLSKARKDA